MHCFLRGWEHILTKVNVWDFCAKQYTSKGITGPEDVMP